MRTVLALLLSLLLFPILEADAQPAERRVALVIGNGKYERFPGLPNPRNDAEDVTEALKGAGFEVIGGVNLTFVEIREKMRQFARAAHGADAALAYYAGHGLQSRSRNYIVPVDAKLQDEGDLDFETILVDDIVATLGRAQGARILILDACRNLPLKEKSTVGQSTQAGLAKISGRGLVVAYATQANALAYDGPGRNSIFTEAFLKTMNEPRLDLPAFFQRVSIAVDQRSGGRQTPELSLSYPGQFFFNRAETELEAWRRISPKDPAALQDFIQRFPHSEFAELARSRLERLDGSKGAAAAGPKTALDDFNRSKQEQFAIFNERQAERTRRRLQREADLQRRADEERQEEEQRAAELGRIEERRRQEAEERRLAELKRRAEEERQRQEAEARRLADLQRKAEEERQKQEAEARRLAELQRKAEEERQKQEAEERRLAELRKAEERQRQEAEAQRLAETQRLADLKRRVEEERQRKEAETRRLAELQRKAEEERQKQEADERRLAELKRRAEEERQRQDAEARRLAELQRKAEEERQRQEAEARRLAELQRKAEEERRQQEAEERRLAEAREIEDRRRQEAEAQRLADMKRLEEERQVVEQRRLTETRQVEARLRAANSSEAQTRGEAQLGSNTTQSDLAREGSVAALSTTPTVRGLEPPATRASSPPAESATPPAAPPEAQDTTPAKPDGRTLLAYSAPKPLPEEKAVPEHPGLAEAVDRDRLREQIEVELHRIRCLKDAADHVWDGKSRRALERYARQARLSTPPGEPDGRLLENLKAIESVPFCPLECGAGMRADGEHCVAVEKPKPEPSIARKPKPEPRETVERPKPPAPREAVRSRPVEAPKPPPREAARPRPEPKPRREAVQPQPRPTPVAVAPRPAPAAPASAPSPRPLKMIGGISGM